MTADSALLDRLQQWLVAREDEHLEFKEAKATFEFEELVKYCTALANEGGGVMVLGVTDKVPRKVVGSQAFKELERTKTGLIDRLRLRVDVSAVQHPSGRVVVFEVPSRPLGMPIPCKGAYWMRGGEGLVPMTPDRLKRIFEETGPDFSAEVCRSADVSDLDAAAIQRLRDMWRRKSRNESLEKLSTEQLLADVELLVDGQVTYAALILLGSHAGLGKLLPQAEVIFEYRSSDASISYQQREEYRQGFFLYHDGLWAKINLRNEMQHYQDGLFVWDIPTFDELVVREAILNSVSHRDYRVSGSVFVRQFPKRLEIVSPGGFPPGITADNILWRQSPRNRRIAEVFSRCGLVERSGQGADRMFERSIRESKQRPDFSGTDDYQVAVALHGEVQDPGFLRFLEQIGKETLASFTTEDLLVLDLIHREEPLRPELKERIARLRERGIIEVTGRGRGTRCLLSRRLYGFLGKRGTYTRKRGLDRAANSALLLKHLENFGEAGIREFEEVLPGLTRGQIHTLLRDLRQRGQIKRVGEKRGSKWGLISSGLSQNSGTKPCEERK